jgi:hypothetical protein
MIGDHPKSRIEGHRGFSCPLHAFWMIKQWKMQLAGHVARTMKKINT